MQIFISLRDERRVVADKIMEARKAEEEAEARKRGGGNGVLSVLEKGEGRGDGPVLAAVRGLWRR